MLPNYLQERRKKSREFFKQYTDENVKIEIVKDQAAQELIEQVLLFFETESSCIYPAKYIFCNIIYSYYLNKYFDLDFKKCLADEDVLKNSPVEYSYKDHVDIYNAILSKLKDIESYTSIKKTRLYFKQEFLIFDEDLTEILI
jgi:hypothetical protein